MSVCLWSLTTQWTVSSRNLSHHIAVPTWAFYSVPLDSEKSASHNFHYRVGAIHVPTNVSSLFCCWRHLYPSLQGSYQSIKCKVKIISDTLLCDNSIKQHLYHVWDYLTMCSKNGISIHGMYVKKFLFCKGNVNFAGFAITVDGMLPLLKSCYLPLPTFLDPTDLTSACAWFGLVNQILWVYAVNPIMQQFHDLIKPSQQLC